MTHAPEIAAQPALIPRELAVIEAGLALQSQGLRLLLAEMQALAELIPTARSAIVDSEVEQGFDNMPV